MRLLQEIALNGFPEVILRGSGLIIVRRLRSEWPGGRQAAVGWVEFFDDRASWA
ncbi:hypothetical protein LWC34_36510 [Kibdelosporangium philippinense]|uniref:Uncharacterized protein n=1 Tax=Kibdelosporangium philippinense TaxID=211113 RepID=A0ABS8ZKG0_9PSEU|nr:hypothetical protein [Kibdelosporangium philippinense]MCE7008279.1 hypothetical protein [Kibdelosporangium philippinense]